MNKKKKIERNRKEVQKAKKKITEMVKRIEALEEFHKEDSAAEFGMDCEEMAENVRRWSAIDWFSKTQRKE